MPKQPIDYSKTIIYKIVCNDLNITDTYVGHTTNMVKRRYNHKDHCNNKNRSKFYNLKIYQTIRDNGGWENWSMIQICEFPCNNEEEARREERKFYEVLNANLNMINPCRKQKEYRDDNKVKIAKRHVEYREANKDKIAEYKKIYSHENIDKIKQRKKRYYDDNKSDILEKLKIWKEKNKDILKEKRKEKYLCCCGITLTTIHKLRHEKSKQHIEFIQKDNNIIS
jgi:hypothetical protein